MPDNDVDKFLAEQKTVEEHRKQLIESLLKKREDQNREIDDQLAKLGYRVNNAKPKRSHHKQEKKPPAPAAQKPKNSSK